MIGTGPRPLQSSPSAPCTAAILAGGRGRRLGGLDKGALVVGGRAIVERQMAIVSQVASRVAIVAGDAARFAHLGVPVIADEVAGAGPLGGIAAALAWSDQPHCLIVACDMPFLSAAFLEHLLMRVGDADVALARTADGRDHPLCAVYARTLLPIVRARVQAGRLEVTSLVQEVRAVVIGPEELAPFDPGHVMLSNVNTPQDLAQACAWADRE
jgi:molybdopterin-guanine dinucleotide biosynthesis protein A